MAHHNSQQNNNPSRSGYVWNSLTPPFTAPINGQQQQQQQQAIHDNNNNSNNNNDSNIAVISSQPASLVSSGSSSSMESTSPQVKTEDELFDKIEDMMCDFMRESSQHYLHCRVLRWSLDDDLSQQFSAVVVINPPVAKH